MSYNTSRRSIQGERAQSAPTITGNRSRELSIPSSQRTVHLWCLGDVSRNVVYVAVLSMLLIIFFLFLLLI